MDSTPSFQIVSRLGEGSYGEVFKAVDTATQQIFAVKVIRLEKDEEGVSQTTLRELAILQSLKHPNVIPQICTYISLEYFKIDIGTDNPRIELYFHHMEEDLSRFLRRSNQLTPQQVKVPPPIGQTILHQIVLGVEYMHLQKVFHRDLKPQNILIDNSLKVKIADFGLGRVISAMLTTMSKEIQTLWYRAPQLLFGNVKYSLQVDVWSLGCIFYELAEGSILFRTESEIGQIMEIMRQLGTPKLQDWQELSSLPNFRPSFPKFNKIQRKYNNLSSAGIDLLERMTEINPNKRISITEARYHRYFSEQ